MENLGVELHHLIEIHNDGYRTSEEDDARIVIVLLIQPEGHTEEEEEVEWTQQLFD